jgi:hypothetical protein
MGLLEDQVQDGEELDPSTGTGDFAIRFQTEIKIPCEGIWSFTTESNDGSIVFLSGK